MTPFIQGVIAVAAVLSACGTLFRAWVAWRDRRDRQRWEGWK